MKAIALATAATLALALASGSVQAQTAAEQTGVNSVLGRAPTTEDFVTKASASDLFEIASSKIAIERGDDATKAFAQQMVVDHEKTSKELSQLIGAGKANVQPATRMTDDQQETVKELGELEGAEFLEAYHSAQVDAHQEAVDLFERYASEGENADLKAWAAKTLPALKHHLQMAEDLESKD